MSDDYTQDTTTAGSVAVGGVATGEIETSGDRDWFAVELVAGRTYTIDLRGSGTRDGTLSDPYLRGIHDADGNLIPGTTNDDGGAGYNSRVTFTASESGSYYIAAGAYASGQGTYEVEVTDTAADDARDGAKDLGDITDLAGPRFPDASLDGDGDRIDYFRFTLTEAKKVGLGLRQQDADADLFLEDAEGNVLASSTVDGTANEAITETLLAGTYYVRVEAQEEGDNDFKLRYGVSAPDPDEVVRLEQQRQGGTNEAPAFAESSYAFDLAENADGSTNGVALGTVSATDPEDATLTYSFEGGNAAGLFEIDASTGALSYKGTGEDYESGTTSYELTVRASDGSLHSDMTVTINVTDVAEAPSFAESSYAFDLAENADGSTNRVALGTVSATDPEGTAVTYSIEGGNAAGLFEINGSTGALSYKGAGEDYESGTTSYELTVRASDGSLHSDTTVTVNVIDVDEQTDADATRGGATDLGDITDLVGPRFPDASLDGDGDRIDYFRFSLTEAKEVALGLRQQDADADLFLEDAEGNVLASSTADGTANEWTAQTLLAGTYYVRVEAQEEGDNDFKLRYGVSAPDPDEVVRLEQQRQGGTNEAPAFAESSYAFDLAENADGSTNGVALGTVSATDPEDATLTYSLEGGNAAGLFEIDASTGALSYKGTGEDYESGTTSYELTVRASDGSLHSDATVTVNVTDVVGDRAQQSYAFDLAENVDGSTNRIVLGTVFAFEPGDVVQSWSISAEGIQNIGFRPWELFEFDGTTGELLYKGTGEDYESGTTSYELTVRVYTDRLQADATVTVTVTDVEDETVPEPLNSQQQQSTVQQSVSEPDGEDLSADISTDGRVTVGGTATGEIGTAGDVDWFAVELRAGTIYRIDLEGFWGGGGTLWDSRLLGVYDESGTPLPGTANDDGGLLFDSRAEFTAARTGTHYVAASADSFYTGTYRVSVTEVGTGDVPVPGAPAFAEASYAFDLAENADGSTNWVALGTVTATDPEDATLTYSIEGGNSAELFEIDASTGALSYKGTGEDYESGTASYELTVRASDGSLHSDVTVTVNVTDAAEAPAFAESSYAFDLAENLDGSTNRVALGTVSATDPEDATPTYSIEDGNSAGLFEIDASTGALSYKGTGEDHESGTTSYVLTVRASDGSLHSDATVTVNVIEDDFTADTSTTGSVAPGGSIAGEIENAGDLDWFAVTAELGNYYRIDLKGLSTGNGTLTDPHIYGIYRSDGSHVNYVTEVSGTGTDSRVVIFLMVTHDPDVPRWSETATFHIAVGGAGSATGTYTLSVEPDDFRQDFLGGGQTGLVHEGGAAHGRWQSSTGNIESAGDQDWFVVHMEAGVTYRIDLEGTGTNALSNPYLRGIYDRAGNLIAGYADDDGGPGLNSRVTFTATEDTYYYVAAGANGDGTGTYALTVTETSRTIPATDNPSDDFAAATATTGTVTAGGSASGVIEVAKDQDWFSVTLEAGGTYEITLETTAEASSFRPYLRGIYDASGDRLPGTSDSSPSQGGRVTFTAAEDGTYYVAAGGYRDTVGTYELSVEVISDGTTDDFRATVPDGTPGGTLGYIAGGRVTASATGRIEAANDQDLFQVRMEAGATYQIDLEGSGTWALSNPFLRGIYDRDGNLIAGSADDDSGPGQNSRVTFTVTESATYYLAAGANGDDTGTYTLTVTHISRSVPPAPDGVSDDFASTTATTGSVTVGGSATGEIDFASDQDWFAVTLEAGTTYRMDLMGSRSDDGTLRDPYLRGIHNAGGELISGTLANDGGWMTNSRVTFTAPEDGTYYVAAGSYDPFFDRTGTYTLSVVEEAM